MATVDPIVRQKIIRDKEDGVINELELEVACALVEMEASSSSDLKSELREVKISGAKEVDCDRSKATVVVIVPYRSWRVIKKVQAKMIRELEKKLQKKNVMFVASRTILNKNYRRQGHVIRPRSRTLTAVHDAILEDIVGPSEIVGRRTFIGVDGSKKLRIFLDPKDKEITEDKLNAFAAVYKMLTNKVAEFSYPVY